MSDMRGGDDDDVSSERVRRSFPPTPDEGDLSGFPPPEAPDAIGQPEVPVNLEELVGRKAGGKAG